MSKKEKYKRVFRDWYYPLKEYGCIELLDEIERDLALLYENSTVYPVTKQIFRAFKECSYQDIKVVLLGQDPYHNLYKGQPSACGLAFATENGYINPSLRYIMQELKDDLGFPNKYKVNSEYEGDNKGGNLATRLLDWPEKGVLLLNTSLTVEKGEPGSHYNVWKEWTERFIRGLSRDRREVVWLLLGQKAQSYRTEMLDQTKTVEAAHPAAEVYKGNSGRIMFLGSRVFSKVNQKLENEGVAPISW